MEIELWQLKNIIEAAAKRAVEQFIIRQNPSKDEINERTAFKEYGRGNVLHWLSIGVLEPPRRQGKSKNSPKIYSRYKLNALRDGVDPLLSAIYQ